MSCSPHPADSLIDFPLLAPNIMWVCDTPPVWRAREKLRGHFLFHSDPGGARNTGGWWGQGRNPFPDPRPTRVFSPRASQSWEFTTTLFHVTKENILLSLPTQLQGHKAQESLSTIKQAQNFLSSPGLSTWRSIHEGEAGLTNSVWPV